VRLAYEGNSIILKIGQAERQINVLVAAVDIEGRAGGEANDLGT
jgi:hypothetical protein